MNKNNSHFQTRWIYLIAIAIFLVFTFIRELGHRKALSACLVNLKQIAQESDSNSGSFIQSFQFFPVNAENGLFGYKNSEGTIIIPKTFTQARYFMEGKAAVADENWYWGFIDLKGQLAIPYQFEGVSDFYNGVAAFNGLKENKHKEGFIDQNGKIIIVLKSEGGSFVNDFSGFKNGYIKSSRWAWAPFHENPHPRVDISIDCTGKVTEIKT